jgi:hypothetical protein
MKRQSGNRLPLVIVRRCQCHADCLAFLTTMICGPANSIQVKRQKIGKKSKVR